MPGAITVAVLNAGLRTQFAGALVAIGHGIVEFPLMFLLFLGMGVALENELVRAWISLIGGAFMLWLAYLALIGLKKTDDSSSFLNQSHPIWLGIILTATNSFFLLWWATIGLSRACIAREFGIHIFIVFAGLHWLCDLIWFTILSSASFKGARLMGGKLQKGIIVICGMAMFVFGLRFIYESFNLFGGT